MSDMELFDNSQYSTLELKDILNKSVKHNSEQVEAKNEFLAYKDEDLNDEFNKIFEKFMDETNKKNHLNRENYCLANKIAYLNEIHSALEHEIMKDNEMAENIETAINEERTKQDIIVKDYYSTMKEIAEKFKELPETYKKVKLEADIKEKKENIEQMKKEFENKTKKSNHFKTQLKEFKKNETIENLKMITDGFCNVEALMAFYQQTEKSLDEKLKLHKQE